MLTIRCIGVGIEAPGRRIYTIFIKSETRISSYTEGVYLSVWISFRGMTSAPDLIY